MRTTIARVVDTLKAFVGRGEFPHAYNCFQHGGSEACEKSNRLLGFNCPKCVAPNALREGRAVARTLEADVRGEVGRG